MADEIDRPVSERGDDRRAIEGARAVQSLAIPLIGSLLQTSGAVWFFCRTPWRGTLSASGLLRTAIGFLLVAAVAHTAAVLLNRRLFREHVDAPLRLLLFATWSCVVWTPLWILLARENSDWVVVPPVAIAAAAVALWKGWSGPREDGQARAAEEGVICSVFRCAKPAAFLWMLAPALLTALLAEGAIAEMLRGERFRAGVLLGLGAIYPLRRYTMQGTVLAWAAMNDGQIARRVAPRTVAVFLLLLLALTPYLGGGGDEWARLLRVEHAPAPTVSRSKEASGRSRGDVYSGVILVMPQKTQREIAVPQQVVETSRSAVGRKPVVIPFDGMYWYFKQPDERPRADAPVVKGDPTEKTIRSTDLRPLSMEAHQRLDRRVAMNSCGALLLVVRNADRGAGGVAVEVRLRDRSAKGNAGQSLGSQVVASSETEAPGDRGRAGKEETLRFAVTRSARGRWFDEILVVIRPSGTRARTGAHLAVERFELLP